MLHRLLVGLAGGLLLVLVPASPALAAPANVTLRVEGAAQTLLPRTAVRTDARIVNKDGVAGHDCPGTTVAGALEIGVAGDWGGTWFDGLGYSVERVGTEAHVFPQPDFFEVRVNNRTLPVGVCAAELQEGDDVLLFVARCEFNPATSACANPPVLPLGLRVPPTVTPGAPFDVSVVEFAPDGTPSPVAGATIEGGDAPATTNAAGIAAVVVGSGGPRALRASKPGRARSALETVCATGGGDGLCGTIVPSSAQAVCRTTGSDGRCGTRDRTPPTARVLGIRNGWRFSRRTAPRALRVQVAPDPSGLLAVKLRLTRNDRGRCTYFSGRFERFRVNRSARCGATNGFFFGVGDREQTSYLLPRRLPRGRYVLDVTAIDRAFNRDGPRSPGRNRVVFHVR
jgi:hypothetical protein